MLTLLIFSIVTKFVVKWKSESHFSIFSFFVRNKKKALFLQKNFFIRNDPKIRSLRKNWKTGKNVGKRKHFGKCDKFFIWKTGVGSLGETDSIFTLSCWEAGSSLKTDNSWSTQELIRHIFPSSSRPLPPIVEFHIHIM